MGFRDFGVEGLGQTSELPVVHKRPVPAFFVHKPALRPLKSA